CARAPGWVCRGGAAMWRTVGHHKPTWSSRESMTAEVHILCEGYLSDGGDRVGSTVGFVRDGGVLVVTDPGLVSGRDAILRPLAELELAPEQITDVVLSHHHPDHTLDAAPFPNPRGHRHSTGYRDDLWVDRPAEGFEL